MRPPASRAFTLRELIISIFVGGVLLAILAILIAPISGTNCPSGPMIQTLSNMKQLHLATQQMALDATATTNLTLGWPGEIGGTFTNWTTQLVHGGYLSASDLTKLLSAPGVTATKKNIFTTNSTAQLVYAVTENSDGIAVFLSTANFTNTPSGGILDPLAQPYGAKGFVVFHKAGDGAILTAKQVGQTNITGSYIPLCR